MNCYLKSLSQHWVYVYYTINIMNFESASNTAKADAIFHTASA
jgi:hypothetical protein